MLIKTQWDVPTHPLKWLKFKRLIISAVGKEVEQLELMYRGCKNSAATVSNRLVSLIKWNIHFEYHPEMPPQVFAQKPEFNHSRQPYPWQPKNWKSPKCSSTGEWKKQIAVHPGDGIPLSNRREEINHLLKNMGESQKQSQWNKCTTSFIKNSSKVETRERKQINYHSGWMKIMWLDLLVRIHHKILTLGIVSYGNNTSIKDMHVGWKKKVCYKVVISSFSTSS